MSQLNESDTFISFDPAKGEVTVGFLDQDKNRLEAVLDINKSLEEKAGEYYDRVKKSKEKLKGAAESLKETESKLANLDLELKQKKRKKVRDSKQFWFEKFRWFISSEGNVVIAGRDAKTNDKIVKKYLSEKDRYAHAEIHGAPSVVIKHNDEEISENTLREACEFALAHSKAWNAKIGSGNAYWVTSDQVSKTPPAGEFLPRGAFMIRGRRNYIQNIKLRLAVGRISYEGAEKIMCASESALESRSQSYVVLEPGDMKKSNLIKKLCAVFDVDQKEVERILPPGDVKIVGRVGISEDSI
jgi:predicted ribosome quality control (RQC) complex YloA/Tae2 family protein